MELLSAVEIAMGARCFGLKKRPEKLNARWPLGRAQIGEPH